MFHKSGFIVLAFVVSVGTSVAHEGATGIVKERMDAMSHVGGTMKTLSQMASGEIPFDGQKASVATQEVAAHMTRFGAQFPEGSNTHPSEAGPNIWTQNAEFLALTKELEEAAARATDVLAGATDATVIPAILADMGKTCKACHAKFRVKH